MSLKNVRINVYVPQAEQILCTAHIYKQTTVKRAPIYALFKHWHTAHGFNWINFICCNKLFKNENESKQKLPTF